MARGNLIQGQGSGKVGDIVLMVRNGQQVSRVYTTSGARTGKEASEASRIQRVKFGGASNQWNLYRYICTRMYRTGRTSKQSDYNYFVKRNNSLLPYLSKEANASGVHVLQPGQFSEGTLGRIELVHEYNPQYSEGVYSFAINDIASAPISAVSWNASMLSFKTVMSDRYPKARKLTYLFSVAEEISIGGIDVTYQSQNVNHYPVVIDLVSEITPGENAGKISEYFASKLGDTRLGTIISALTTVCANQARVMMVSPQSEDDNSYMGKVGCLLFATDDNVGDSYTTILPENAINPTAGPFVDWAGYRTTTALRVAADSYGYQSGVMRDTIAGAGNEIAIQVQAYAAKLASFNKDASAAFLKSVGDVSQVQAKEVIKPAEKK